MQNLNSNQHPRKKSLENPIDIVAIVGNSPIKRLKIRWNIKSIKILQSSMKKTGKKYVDNQWWVKLMHAGKNLHV